MTTEPSSRAVDRGQQVPLKVLLVEDSRVEAKLVVAALRKGGFDPAWKRVMLLEELVAALEVQRWDVVLCDHNLPGYTALDALQVIRTTAPLLPVIVVTGVVGEEAAVSCMRAGARDLLLKDRLHRLAPAIRRELEQADVRRERHRARRELEVSHRFLTIANRHTRLGPLLEDWLDVLMKVTRVSAAGIRTVEQDGRLDYRAHRGLSDRFLALEEALLLDQHCLCSRVARGDTADLPLEVTAHGSCWTPDLSEALSTAAEPFDDMRRGCVEEGFESIAIVPVVLGDQIAGLIHLADPRPGFLDAQQVSLMEILSVMLGTAMGRIWALAELRHKERLYRTLVELSPDAIFVADNESRVVAANPRSAVMYGHEDPSSLLGRNLDTLINGHKLHVAADMEQEVLDAGRRGTEHLQRRSDDTTFPAELHASVMKHDGVRRGTVVSVRDLTERHDMQAQLAQADRLASVGMLAAGVAHEVNNPLTYVLQNLNWLIDGLRAAEEEDGEDLDDQIQAATEARDGAGRVRDIVRDLRTFSSVDGYSLGPVNVNEVLRLASNMARGQIKNRARLVGRPGDVSPVMANEGRLAQVVLNVLINAVQAIEEGSVEANEIELRSWEEDGEVLVSVRDSGSGIPAENMEKLFTPFFTTKASGVGSGLGLAVCQSLMSHFKGRMEVESELGQGTVVTMRLPAAPRERDPRSHTSAVPPETAADTARGRILIVDDEPILLSSMARLLRKHEVVKAESGVVARDILLQDRRFDVIFCDLLMPGMTGMDLFYWLQEEDASLAERMVFTSGDLKQQRLSEFLDDIENLRLDKPFESSDLMEIVDRMIVRAGDG